MKNTGIRFTIGLGYGIGAFGLMLFNLSVSIFLLYFYTDVVGIPSRIAGYVIFAAMIWDAVTDPAMGLLADRTATRWGKYRPYMFGGAPILAAVFVMMFGLAYLDGSSVILLAIVTTLAYRTAFTVVWMPFTTLIAVITQDYRARSDLTAYKTFFVSIAGISVSASVLYLVQWFGGGNDAAGFFRSAVAIALLATLCIWVCCLLVPEADRRGAGDSPGSVTAGALGANRYNVRQFIDASFRNVPFLQVFVASFVLLVAWNCLWQTTVYYFKYCIGNAAMASAALTGFHICQAVAAIFWARLTPALGKRGVWVVGASISAASLAILALHPAPSSAFAVTLVSVFGIGTSAFLVTYYSALADTVDFGEVLSGVRCEALLFGVLAFAQKASFGVASGLVGTALDAIGFQANVAQEPETLFGIRMIFTLFPVSGFVLSAIIMIFYRLSDDRHAALLQELRSRRALAKV